MTEFQGDPAVAEADIQRALEGASEADRALAAAVARVEAITNEPFDGSPEAEADIARRVARAERKVERCEERLAEAEEDMSHTFDRWVDEGYLS